MACESVKFRVSMLFVYKSCTTDGGVVGICSQKRNLFNTGTKMPVWVRVCQFGAWSFINESQFGKRTQKMQIWVFYGILRWSIIIKYLLNCIQIFYSLNQITRSTLVGKPTELPIIIILCQQFWCRFSLGSGTKSQAIIMISASYSASLRRTKKTPRRS